MRDHNTDKDVVGLPAQSCFRSKLHAHAEDPRMIVHGRQRSRYGMIWYNRDLIGDAEVELHTVVDLKTAKHNARAHKELVSVGAHAARPLSVVKGEFRPEIGGNMVLQGQAAVDRGADRMLIGGRDRHANRSLDIEITEADAARDRGSDDPSLLVKAGTPVGA